MNYDGKKERERKWLFFQNYSSSFKTIIKSNRKKASFFFQSHCTIIVRESSLLFHGERRGGERRSTV